MDERWTGIRNAAVRVEEAADRAREADKLFLQNAAGGSGAGMVGAVQSFSGALKERLRMRASDLEERARGIRHLVELIPDGVLSPPAEAAIYHALSGL